MDKIYVGTKQPAMLNKVLTADATGKHKKAYSMYRKDSGGKAEAYDTIDWVLWGMPTFVYPVIGANQKQVEPKVVVYDAQGVASFKVVNLTAQEIASALVIYKEQKLSSVRFESKQHIEATYPDWYQRNVSLGIMEDTNMVGDIADVITESNRCEDAIDASANTVAVDAAHATLNFPAIGG